MLASLLPLPCPGCGRPADPVCARCRGALVPAPPAAPPCGVRAWAAPFAYEGVARELVARVKYRRRHAVIGWLAAEMARLVGPPLPDVVTWVPTTPARRRERGFDHAELLARAVGRQVRRPVRRLLFRGPGEAQTGRAARERRRGPALAASAAVAASVLVVDDVATTGASVAAAAAALHAAGARTVDVVTAARTPARAI